jgi:peptide/nickel transport system permease protein
MRMTDVFLSLPPLVLALTVASVLPASTLNGVLALSVASWPWYTRMIYSKVTSLRNEPYILRARLLGTGTTRILFTELLPNCVSQVITKMSLEMGSVVLMGATLSFVGLGEKPPSPGLGTMLADGTQYLPAQWWVTIFPALAILLIVVGFNLLGDGLRDLYGGEP